VVDGQIGAVGDVGVYSSVSTANEGSDAAIRRLLGREPSVVSVTNCPREVTALKEDGVSIASFRRLYNA
jgi:hypothetical protein